jgi:ketosteroid isomerase-like protein
MSEMRAAGMTIVAVVLAPFAMGAGASFNAPRDVKEVASIEHDLATLTSMKDLIKYYAPDAVVLDIFAPGKYRGTQQIYDAFEQQLQGVRSMQSEMPDLNVMSDGRFACAALQLRFNIVTTDGTQFKLAVRQLDAFKKIHGRWLIVQQHISVPVDQKSGMGLLNASPPVRGAITWAANPLPGPATTGPQAKKEIRDWLVVGAVSPDLDTLMKYYGPGDDLLVYDVGFPPGEFRGLKEVRDGFAPVMNMTNPQMKLLDFVADSDGGFGIQLDVQQLTITPKGGKTTTFVLRQSDCMRRVDGKWYSAMEELSMPIDAATGKAVTQP